MSLKVGFDLDNCIFEFMDYYISKFGKPKSDFEITKNVTRKLSKNKEFWLNEPLIRRPNFTPALYCTKRVHNKEWTKEQLRIHNLPNAPIYQIYCQIQSKAPKVKGKVDVFIDDSISNFIDLNLNGVPCLLIDDKYNQRWGPVGRIFSLNIEEIEDAYYEFKENIFPLFKYLVSDYKQRIS